MNTEDHFFSTILECKDDLDKKIQFSTVAMIMGLNVHNFIFVDNKLWDDYFGKIVNLARSLQKMNEHYRKYVIEEKRFLEEFHTRCSASNQNTHSATTAVSLSTELDGLLSHFKSGLDTLATTLNPLFGLKFDAWHKGKDELGAEKSGIKIINSLTRNLENNEKMKAEPLINYIKENIEWATYLVNLRDKVHHHGGLKKVSDVFYNFKTKEVIPQMIFHKKDSKELVENFMLRTLNESIEFFNTILVLCLEIKAPGDDMFIRKSGEEFPPFRWVVTKRVLK